MSYQGCSNCKHFNWNKGNCKAFPKGVPLPIKSGEVEHIKKLPGQQGDTLYQPLEEPEFSDRNLDNLDFARTRLAGNTKQTKQCKKGWSCGFSCISKGKECKSALPGQAKTYADWMTKQTKQLTVMNGGGKQTGADGATSLAIKQRTALVNAAQSVKTSTQIDTPQPSQSRQITDQDKTQARAAIRLMQSTGVSADQITKYAKDWGIDPDEIKGATGLTAISGSGKSSGNSKPSSRLAAVKTAKDVLVGGKADHLASDGYETVKVGNREVAIDHSSARYTTSQGKDVWMMNATVDLTGADPKIKKKDALKQGFDQAMGKLIKDYPDGQLVVFSHNTALSSLSRKEVTDLLDSSGFGRARSGRGQHEQFAIVQKGKLNPIDPDEIDKLVSSPNFSEMNFSEIEIEILPKGTHTSSNGFKLPVSDRDLDDLVASYNPANFQAPLIISHDTKGLSDREIGNSEFSFGVPKRLKRVGDRVKAVFDKVAPEFAQWVREGKLLSVSPSFYLPSSPSNPTPGKLSLRHIAALGRSAPAIKGMQPLQEAFNFNESEEGVVNFNFEANEATIEFGDTDDRLIAQTFQNLRDWMISEFDLETANRVIPAYVVGILIEDAAKEDSDYPNYQAMTTDKELEFSERERQLQEREAALLKKELISFCETDLKGRITPAIAPQDQLVNFMAFLASQETVDFSEDKSEAPLEWFKGFLQRLPKQVEFSEVAKDGIPYQELPNSADFSAEEVEYDRQIRNFCEKHGLNPSKSEDYAKAMTELGILY